MEVSEDDVDVLGSVDEVRPLENPLEPGARADYENVGALSQERGACLPLARRKPTTAAEKHAIHGIRGPLRI